MARATEGNTGPARFLASPIGRCDGLIYLPNTPFIHLKGWLFLLLGLLGATGLLLESPHFRTALLLAIAVWSFCRFYYYLFYVLERYLGKTTPYAGILDAIRFVIRK